MKTPSSSICQPVCIVSLNVIAIGCLLLSATLTEARPTIRKAFFSIYTNAVGTTLDSVPSHSGHCGVCHYDFNGGGTRNLYGAAVQAIYDTNGMNATAAILAVRAADSDSDGFSNDTEITNTVTYANTPTFPGLTTANTNLVSNVALGDIAGHLTPVIGGDTTPPAVTLLAPNGGEIFVANLPTNVTWSASDASGVAAINIYVSLDNGSTYQQVARNLGNAGTYSWVPADRPTAQARIKVVAADTYGNTNFDVSDAAFTIVSGAFTNIHGVASTLRDFDMPGTQPFEHGPDLDSSASCATCHGGYDQSVEPHFNWQGSMMANAARDPLFMANMAIANQDAANSGDLCLRCHFSRGWLAGRSVPTDGSRMQAADRDGVTCALCHRMVNPVYTAGVSPTNDVPILAALSFAGTNYGNGMFVIDSTGLRRGPYTNATLGHDAIGSPFHRSAAFCGTCHDVSNPAFTKDNDGVYQPNTFDAASTTFSPHFMAPVERTFSEWLNSDYASSNGVYAPQFAGNRPDGRVSTCQQCHLHSTSGYICNTNINPGVPLRTDMGLHDMTGGSTWLPGLLTNLYPTEVNAAAIQAGISRATQMLTNAATLVVGDTNDILIVTVTNECGHKLPTGYPEGRRVWVNVKFYDQASALLGESCAYNPTNGVLTRDAEAKIYEVHPGIDTNISGLLGLDADASFHFVLNNKTYEDNRIPPRGFTNTTYAAFGGAPVGYSYADGQYWDDSLYNLPAGTVRANVKLYYQSTSKEFVEFLRDENHSNTNGQAIYDLWNNNGKCPPTLMAQTTWVTAYATKSVSMTPTNSFRLEFFSRPGLNYAIEFKNTLTDANWQPFVAHGSFAATNSVSWFEDEFTAQTSGGPSATGARFYRIKYTVP
ncbi:MAG: Ig-like domain-containing protein [Verrucomicrobiales bacterium]|nr:Ig-like domain-containing protein [Verrucomicrobiales bacterium]